jgi:N-acetylmuramoyl-L-alanine amidase
LSSLLSEVKMRMFLLIQALLVNQPQKAPKTGLPLANIQVVVDPGHGGLNPGVRYHFGSAKEKMVFVEKVYTCDVSARLIGLLKNLGAQVVSTVQGPCLKKPQNNLPVSIVRRQKPDEFFTTTGQEVRGDSSGLMERVHLAKQAAVLHPSKLTIYVSIHFDSAISKKMQGTYIIVPRGETTDPLATSLAKEFNDAGLGQNFCKKPTIIVTTGTCGIKHVLILKNPPVRNMVLLELGNVTNYRDRSWMLNPIDRQKYADIIAHGILRFSK